MGCIMGTPVAGRRATSTGFTLSKSKCFHLVFIKLGEYVGGHNISTKFYNQSNPPGTPELWPLNCPKLGFPLSKSKSFHPVFIKLGEYVGGHNISTKFYNLLNLPRHSWIMALELSKNSISGICSPIRISCSQKCCHYHWNYDKYDGRILCQFGTLVIIIIIIIIIIIVYVFIIIMMIVNVSGRFDEAIQDMREALSYKPDFLPARECLKQAEADKLAQLTKQSP